MWLVLTFSHLKVVDGQADCCKACHKDVRKTRTSKSTKSGNLLMTICLDVSRGPLDLRSWPESKVITADNQRARSDIAKL
jgi:hypothetical protein